MNIFHVFNELFVVIIQLSNRTFLCAERVEPPRTPTWGARTPTSPRNPTTCPTSVSMKGVAGNENGWSEGTDISGKN